MEMHHRLTFHCPCNPLRRDHAIIAAIKKIPHLNNIRYLWTDAFALLSYQSLSEYYIQNNDKEKAKLYEVAVEKLISVVHECLGKPRSSREEDGMRKCEISPTGYVGLRIGKVETKKVTDFGMEYDGQYFHYIDKWLLALARTNHVEEGIRISKSIFPYFFSDSRYSEVGGIRWKLSIGKYSSMPLSRKQSYSIYSNLLISLSLHS